jgi:hypothetical protein
VPATAHMSGHYVSPGGRGDLRSSACSHDGTL